MQNHNNKPNKDRKDRTTLSVDKDILQKFKEYCKGKGMKISSKIELFMIDEIKNYDGHKK
mgnify:CR=1 FL=1